MDIQYLIAQAKKHLGHSEITRVFELLDEIAFNETQLRKRLAAYEGEPELSIIEKCADAYADKVGQETWNSGVRIIIETFQKAIAASVEATKERE